MESQHHLDSWWGGVPQRRESPQRAETATHTRANARSSQVSNLNLISFAAANYNFSLIAIMSHPVSCTLPGSNQMTSTRGTSPQAKLISIPWCSWWWIGARWYPSGRTSCFGTTACKTRSGTWYSRSCEAWAHTKYNANVWHKISLIKNFTQITFEI